MRLKRLGALDSGTVPRTGGTYGEPEAVFGQRADPDVTRALDALQKPPSIWPGFLGVAVERITPIEVAVAALASDATAPLPIGGQP